MIYKEQTYRDTRYMLKNGILSDNEVSLTKLTEDIISIDNRCALKINILGESHLIEYHFKNHIFTEVVACFEDQNNIQLPTTNKYLDAYSFASETFDLMYINEDDYKNLISNENFILIKKISKKFPTKENLTFEAITSISVYTNDNNIKIRTIHTYPNETKALITESILSI